MLKFASPVACTYGKRYATNFKHEVLFEQDELRQETISKILVFLNDE